MDPQQLNLGFSGRSISSMSFSPSQLRGFADMSLFVARRLAGVAIVAFAVGACSPQSSVAAGAAQAEQPAPIAAPAQPPSSPQPVGTLNGRVLPDFATLVEQVGPAVVNVSVLEKAHRVGKQSPDDADDPVQEFFRRFGMPNGPQGDVASKINRARVKARASSSAPTATSSPTRTWSPMPTKSRCARRTAANTPPRSSASTSAPTSPSSRSKARTCRWCARRSVEAASG